MSFRRPTLLRGPILALALLLAPAAVAQEGDESGIPPQSDTPWQMAGASWSGAMSAAAIEANVTARDARSWEILWQMVGEPAPSALPAGRMAVAIFSMAEEGPPRTIEISEVIAGNTALVIGYRSVPVENAETDADAETPESEAESGPGEAITAPYVVRLLPLTDLPVYYVGSVTIPESQ